MHDEVRHLRDFDLCHQCIEGDEVAIKTLRGRSEGAAVAYLVGAGGESSECRDLVESLWTDLLAPAEGLPRISRYNGTCAFQTWFNTIALNRLISKKREDQRRQKRFPLHLDSAADGEGSLPRGSTADPDPEEPGNAVLIEMMRIAIEHAFRSCPPEDFVLLQLRHCDGLMGKELAVMFRCDPSGITHRLKKAKQRISSETMRKIRQQDPWLELRWKDFLELCRTTTPACFGLD